MNQKENEIKRWKFLLKLRSDRKKRFVEINAPQIVIERESLLIKEAMCKLTELGVEGYEIAPN